MEELNATAASLLGFLQEGPMSGWDLAQRVEGSIGYFWNLTRSQVYRELRQLEKEGLIRKEGKRGTREKQEFAITQTGREAFLQWLDREPPEELIRFPLLLTLFFGQHIPEEHLKRYLQIHRLRHEGRLQTYRGILKEVEREHPFAAHTVRFGITYEEGVLRWFDELPWFRKRARRRIRSQRSS